MSQTTTAVQQLVEACQIRELNPINHFGPNTKVSDSYPVTVTLTWGQIQAIAAARNAVERELAPHSPDGRWNALDSID